MDERRSAESRKAESTAVTPVTLLSSFFIYDFHIGRKKTMWKIVKKKRNRKGTCNS